MSKNKWKWLGIISTSLAVCAIGGNIWVWIYTGTYHFWIPSFLPMVAVITLNTADSIQNHQFLEAFLWWLGTILAYGTMFLPGHVVYSALALFAFHKYRRKGHEESQSSLSSIAGDHVRDGISEQRQEA